MTSDTGFLARIERLLAHEAAGGVVIIAATLLALIAANTNALAGYEALLAKPLSIRFDGAGLTKPLALWINDGLMAVFFFLIGLELKREMLEGRLTRPADVILPGAAALGGMLIPALVFLALTRGVPGLSVGWAIPTATDIAFALGILALVGRGLPPGLKLFLLTLAILDDLGAIIIIAVFYNHGLDPVWLGWAVVPLVGLLALNLLGAHRKAPFVILGAILWVMVLKSGVHATLAGVITALFIPLKDRHGASPLHSLEHALWPYVTFLIVPVFAFANAGVVLTGLQLSDLAKPLPLGIAAGLFVGKQVGVLGVTALLVATGAVRLPQGVGWLQIWGLSALAGVGFTMSLFIGSLSFDAPEAMNAVRLGVLTGSGLSAVLGFALLRASLRR